MNLTKTLNNIFDLFGFYFWVKNKVREKAIVQTRKKMPSKINITSGKWNSAIMGQESRAMRRQRNPDWTSKEEKNIIQGQTGI
jgi:hypothetical protein